MVSVDRVLAWEEKAKKEWKCLRCGKCCLYFYTLQATEEDLAVWEDAGRGDILRCCFMGDLWFSPKTGEELDRCPFLRKGKGKKYSCRIHELRPEVCQGFPLWTQGRRETGKPGVPTMWARKFPCLRRLVKLLGTDGLIDNRC